MVTEEAGQRVKKKGVVSKKPAPFAVDTEEGSGRKASRVGVETRKKILDAAEHLFADKGFEGTSLRDISEASDSHLALSTYHFGNKEQLFDEVVRRRAVELVNQRLAGLARIDLDAQPPEETVRLLIDAYVNPMIKARFGKSQQWQSWVRLMSSIINIKRWTPLIQKHFDECAEIYVASWRKALPDADHVSLLNGFSFMAVTTLYVCNYTDRFQTLKKLPRRSKNQDLDALTEDLVRFLHAGFMAL